MRKELSVPISKKVKKLKFGSNVGAEHVMCRFKWDYPIVNLVSGHSRTCCRVPKQVITSKDIKKYGKDVILNTEYERKRRYEKLVGITHLDCESCLRLEYNGVDAPRSGIEDFMRGYVQRNKVAKITHSNMNQAFHEIYDPKKLSPSSPLTRSDHSEMLEIILGNTCDLKCTYCSVHYSSQWAKELIDNGDLTKKEYDKQFPKAPEELEPVFWEWFYDVGRHSTRTINILGGEPTYINKFYDVMEKLMAAYKDLEQKPSHIVELGILSNMNTKQDNFNRFMSYLPRLGQHFRVRLQPSIEALGQRAEYIRFNLSWPRLVHNVKSVLRESKKHNLGPDQFMMGFQIALNAFSVSSLPQFVNWVNGLNEEFDVELGLMKNIVSFPRHHNPNILTPDFARYIRAAMNIIEAHEGKNDRISSQQLYYGSWQSYRLDLLASLQRTLESDNRSAFDIESRKDFYEFVVKNDSRRGCNFLDTYPEYKNFYELCRAQSLH